MVDTGDTASLPIDDCPTPHVRVEERDDMVCGTFSLPRNTAAAAYLRMLGARAVPQVDAPTAMPVIDDAVTQDPFLSVVIRTQGKRIEELTDVLLCLAGQQDDDFEVLIVGHRVEEGRREPLLDLLRSFPRSLTRRIRYCFVDHGTRTTPLRIGFTLARGRYVSILDDDDLVMDTWTSSFKGLARNNDGKMLHSYAVTQKWGTRPTAEPEHRELYAQGTFDNGYCHDFSVSAQMSVNSCPLMSLAFPRFVFASLGIDFDEQLTTMEDWDFLMRVYALCGVVSKDEVTSIYRLWTNAESSHTLHTTEEWDLNYKKIVDKMNGRPYLLDTGAVEDVRAHSPQSAISREALAQSACLAAYETSQTERTLWRDVALLHQGKSSKVEAECVRGHVATGEWDLSFFFNDDPLVSMLVLSPLRAPFKVLGEFRMRVVDGDGSEQVLDFANCSVHNGYQVDCNHIVYLKENPFVAFTLAKPVHVQRVDFSFKLMATVADYYVDQVTLGKKGLTIGRARRWLNRKLHSDE